MAEGDAGLDQHRRWKETEAQGAEGRWLRARAPLTAAMDLGPPAVGEPSAPSSVVMLRLDRRNDSALLRARRIVDARASMSSTSGSGCSVFLLPFRHLWL